MPSARFVNSSFLEPSLPTMTRVACRFADAGLVATRVATAASWIAVVPALTDGCSDSADGLYCGGRYHRCHHGQRNCGNKSRPQKAAATNCHKGCWPRDFILQKVGLLQLIERQPNNPVVDGAIMVLLQRQRPR